MCTTTPENEKTQAHKAKNQTNDAVQGYSAAQARQEQTSTALGRLHGHAWTVATSIRNDLFPAAIQPPKRLKQTGETLRPCCAAGKWRSHGKILGSKNSTTNDTQHRFWPPQTQRTLHGGGRKKLAITQTAGVEGLRRLLAFAPSVTAARKTKRKL